MPSSAAASAPVGRRALVRRAAWAGVVVAGSATLAACGLLDRVPAPRPREADADEPLVREALTDQRRVLAAVQAAGTEQPAVATTLALLVEHHRVHVQVLGGDPDATATPSPTASPTASPSAAPSTPAATLARVRALETAASQARRRDAGTAASGDLARVLAAMAAGQAQHVVLLDRAAGALR